MSHVAQRATRKPMDSFTRVRRAACKRRQTISNVIVPARINAPWRKIALCFAQCLAVLSKKQWS
jgi:hypothetical protein